jgi:hypothetical protein
MDRVMRTEVRLHVPHPHFMTSADYGAAWWLATYQRAANHQWFLAQLAKIGR